MQKIFQVINFKTLVIAMLSVASTYVCIQLKITAEYPLTLIATAIIFPIVFSINSAYKRRESALIEYGAMKSHGKALFFAARDWLEKPPEKTLTQSRQLLAELLDSCRVLFSSPASELRNNEEKVYQCFSNLSRFIKTDLRDNGLPSGEVSRCNQYLSKMFSSFENMKHIYQYRTPRSLRTFSTIFITVLPVIYGPYFAHEALRYSPEVTYVMPILFSMVLVSLSNIQEHLENPFDGVGEDDISFNVEEFVDRLYN